MKHSMLNETILLLKEIRSQQGNTGDRVIKSLNQVIENLKSLRGEGFSEPELNSLILEELGNLFSAFPELQE